MSKKETTPFMRAITHALSGVTQTSALGRVLVAGAVQEALMNVCAEYGLNTRDVLAKYMDPIVDKYSAVSTTPTAETCKASVSRGGKRCKKEAMHAGYCVFHQDLAAADEQHRRRVDAYKLQIANGARDEPATAMMRDLRGGASAAEQTLVMPLINIEDLL